MDFKTALARQRRNKKICKKILNDLGKFGFKEISFKFVAIILLFALNIGFLNVPVTNAYYNDIENSSGNSWTTGALDFTLTDNGLNPISASLNFESGTTTSKTVGMALEAGSNPIKYTISTIDISGDVTFCDAINLNASLDNQSQFSGSLTSFISSATTTISNWQYNFSLNSNFYNNICSFSFEYDGRQTLPHNEYADGGFYDIEKASSTIYSWGFRINKVYYDVSPDRGAEGDNEWVEIYNQTDQALDINNWQICDNNSCDALASSSPIMIPAKGFGVITASSTTWNYWEIPNNVVKIVLGNEIGNGLSNGGDRLILKRPDGAIIDQMNWKNDTGVWNPGATNVPDGHMLGRKPNGYDTNQPSDFVDLAPPLLNLINPDQSGTLTWYWTYNYNITWMAINPNGFDSDLKINLAYIKDIDGSNTITPSDPIIPIASNLFNSGSYNWTVPSGFLGYIWIKISAFGPENPMLNTKMTSGKIYDPYPIELILTDPQTVLDSILDLVDNLSATTTLEVIAETKLATTTPEIILENSSTFSVTEEIMILATTTLEIITETASSTPEIIPVVESEPIIKTEVVDGIVSEPIIAPEPIIESAPAEVSPAVESVPVAESFPAVEPPILEPALVIPTE